MGQSDLAKKAQEFLEELSLDVPKERQFKTLVAVSKTRTVKEIQEVFDQGVVHFGESYLKEALSKKNQLSTINIKWHYIGRVQTGMLNQLANRFDFVDSIFKPKHLIKLNALTRAKQNILIQVSLEEDLRGNGVAISKFEEHMEPLWQLGKLVFRGVMFLPPPNLSEAQLKRAFLKVSEVFQKLKEGRPDWDTLSMGMSQDYKLALECGATQVRIGTALFGERKSL